MQRRDDQIMKAQYQDRRLKSVQVQNQVQPPQPQKCPRCDSLNTKFCYYNNYSLSQPRYLCKTCRRYWTQGGTLRNVPVGGGCRKGKRAKQSSHSSDNNANSQPPPPQIVPSSLTTTPQQLIFTGAPVIATSSFFNPVGELGSSSSWVNSFGSSQGQCQIQPPEIIYEMMDQSSGKAAVSSSSPAGWPESYINNCISNSNPIATAGDAIVWTAGNSNGSNPTNNNAAINQWPDYMPGFCPPP